MLCGGLGQVGEAGGAEWPLGRGLDFAAGVFADGLAQGFAGVGNERGDVDQGLDIGAVGCGVGDECTAEECPTRIAGPSDAAQGGYPVSRPSAPPQQEPATGGGHDD